MQSVYRLVETVNQFYREINPATLSGAIDVVVVQKPNGELACSPFHVRFGKLLVLMPQEKKVEITVNGKVVDFPMKIGEAGEAFFVFETENNVPEELQTSPLELDFLDLGGGSSNDLSSKKKDQDEPETIDYIYGVGGDGSDSVLTDSNITVTPTSDDVTVNDESNLSKELYDPNCNLDQKLKFDNDNDLNTNLVSDKINESINGRDVDDKDQSNSLNEKNDDAASETYKDNIKNINSNENNENINLGKIFDQLPNDQNHLIYENASKRNRERTSSVTSIHQNCSGKPEGPFSDTELDETRKPEKPLERRMNNKTSPLSDTELEYEHNNPPKDSEEWSWGWGTLPVRKSEKFEHWQDDDAEDKKWDKGENEDGNSSGFEIDGKKYHFEMSLCNKNAFGSDLQTDAELFRQNLVTYEQFSQNPQILSDKTLKPLPESTMASLANNRLEPDRRRYSLREWSRWWSRSSSIERPINNIRDKEKAIQETEKDQNKSKKFYAKTLRLTSDQLKSLNLKKGMNTIIFSVASYKGKATCAARIFLWDYDTKIVISDIDGTITKSDALGHVFAMIGKDWTHSGVAKLYSDIRRNGYQILYLTSRAIGQASYTRGYLQKVEQGKYQLPDGPVIMSPDRLLTAFHREVIMRKPEVFKMSCLRDVKKLFDDHNPFYAGFGNRITDALSYRSVDIPSSRIFTIGFNGEVKLELLTGYKSTYVDLTDLVDQMFPHVDSKEWDTVYNDWNYWKPPLPEVEIPSEIFNTVTSTPSSPKSQSVAMTSSPSLGMIRNLAGSIKKSSSKDHEIFDLVDDLENAEGEDVTFYSWLGVKPTASEKEINKAYRKLSLTLHPDKNPDRDSKEKFSRLGLIGAILRNSESRERYNFFLKNGVPKWRGTGYYYNRHRPGLESREIAWGKRMKKQNTRKKIFVNEKNFIVDYDNVFLLTKDGKQFIMDENEIEKPRILNIFEKYNLDK
ncbi:3377_t:CDS:10 [Entrophospora sp. SA101]|nr:3377_t:CDS:10 [Entrophospora sp. SA101]